ncbi:hypothetical protein KAU11_03475 [Candidatus Babeliales bacterium]|nr:hypothetical protein [Candidatus Babeliales bacterium]
MKILSITHTETITEPNTVKYSAAHNSYFCSKPITICLDVETDEQGIINLNAQTSDVLEFHNYNSVCFNESIDCNHCDLSEENWDEVIKFAQDIYDNDEYDNEAYAELYELAVKIADEKNREAGCQVAEPKIENNLEVFEVEEGNWAATFSGIDGSDNPCFESVAEHIMANTEEEAIVKAKCIHGLF